MNLKQAATAGGSCECADGFFMDTNGACIACPEGCTSCTDAETCAGCNTGFSFIGTQCFCASLLNFVNSDKECVTCASVFPGCDTCTNATQCTRCS